MRTGRSSLLGLMGLISVVAVTLHAIRSAPTIWLQIYVNGLALLLIAAPLRARFAASRAARDWWFGFALFGWAWMLLRIVEGHRWLPIGWLEGAVGDPLIMPFLPFPSDKFPYTAARHKANGDYADRGFEIVLMALTFTIAYAGAWLTALLGRRARRREEA